MIRLFTAIPLTEEIRTCLHAMGRSLPGARPVPPDQIHVTLRFIGEVEGGLFRSITEALATVTTSPFSLKVQGVGHFPPRGKPRVVWAGLYPSEPLTTLKRKIDSCLQPCGIGPDQRKFTPHVTMARLESCPLGRLTAFLAGNSFLQFDAGEIRSFALYSSKLSSKGAIHILEQSYPLQP